MKRYETLEAGSDYNFSDYLTDREYVEGREPTLQDLKALWSVYGDDYIEFCKAEGFHFERL